MQFKNHIHTVYYKIMLYHSLNVIHLVSVERYVLQ